MNHRRRGGVGFKEILIFAVLIVGGALAVQYFNQKPPVVKTVVVHEEAPPPPPVVEQAPPPPPPPAPVIRPAPIVTPPLPRVVIAAPPPTPECQIIEAKLRDARAAAGEAKANLDAANKAAIKSVQLTAQYAAAKDDADAKKAAEKTALDKLNADRDAGNETDDEKTAVQTAQADWLAAASKLTQIQDDAVANDERIAHAEFVLKDATDRVTALENVLNANVEDDVDKARNPDDLSLRAVAVDPATNTVSIDLDQTSLNGAGTDAAVSTIGHLLEKSLRNAQYDWDSAVFTVYFTYNGNDAVEFQAVYGRPQVEQSNAALGMNRGGYFDDSGIINLAREFWISPVVSTPNIENVAMVNTPGGQNQSVDGSADGATVGTEYLGGVWYDVIVVGGYRRADGSWCAKQFVKREHHQTATSGAGNTKGQPPRQTASQVRAQTSNQPAQRASTPARTVSAPIAAPTMVPIVRP